MRNLITSHRGTINVCSKEVPDLPLVSAVFDPVGDTMLCTFGPTEDFKQIEIQQLSKTGEEALFACWPLDSDSDTVPEIKDVKYFGDNNTAVVILSTGDIISITGDESGQGEAVIEIVGTLEDGIEAAAWSPDEEILTVVTPNTVVFLSRIFDPVAEAQISTDDLKISKHVSVGWGKKETQFQGKGAKAMRDPTVPEKVDSGFVNENDKGGMEISWRGDGEYVALNSIDKTDSVTRRTVRVYTRNGQLNSVSEPVDTMEGHLSWRPSGNVLASIQRKSSQPDNEGPDLIFFERNGLRRYEFSIRTNEQQQIKDIAWNVDSDILAIMLEDRVQLWTTKNYHWYLKQEVFSRNMPEARPQWMSWHPEKPLTLLISFGEFLEVHQYLWTTIDGSLAPPNDLGTSVVVDGQLVKITPLKIANTPPPMSFRDFAVDSTPVHVAVSLSNKHFAVLGRDSVEIASWDPTTKPVGAPAINKVIALSEVCGVPMAPKQITFLGDDVVVVVADVSAGSGIFVIDVNKSSLITTHAVEQEIYILKTQEDGQRVVYESVDGSVYRLDEEYEIELIYKLPQRCDSLEVWKHIAFGLTASGKLFANHRMLANSVTSLKLTQSHVLFTTAQHYLKFSHLHESVDEFEVPEDDVVNDERCRSIERGSLLVSVMPSKTALTLQAPRGNLETIHPRILVLSEIRRNIEAKRYDSAFTACRVHRIDMNLLHDYAPQQFFTHTELFVKQLHKIEYIDLFLSGLRNEDVSQTMYKQTLKESAIADEVAGEGDVDSLSTKVNRICDAMLEVLLPKPEYLQSVLTAYGCKSPPDLEAALGFIGKDRVHDPAKAEFSVQHLCFLQDVELVYETALGIYDLDLALLVAQQSQKDPKEYLPFLRDLQESGEIRRKFKVDDYLRKYSKAMHHLAQESDSFEELEDYMVQHKLYTEALRLFKYDQAKQNSIFKLYASHLQGKTLYSEAAMVYENLGLFDDALDSYRMAADWRQAFSILQNPEFNEEKRQEVIEHMAEVTEETKSYFDSGIINIDYLGHVSHGLGLWCKGYYFADAIRRASLEKNYEDLLANVIDPGMLEGFATISELITDCKGQIKSQVKRLRELREKKQADPLGFFGTPDDSEAPDNVSIAPTETSTAPSFLTRYTGKTGETAKTGASRRTSKNRRREERKKARGKKGSAFEEEYLMNSIKRLAERLDQTEDDAVRLIDALVRRGYRDHAHQVQKGYVELRHELGEIVGEVFNQTEEDLKRYDPDGNQFLADRIEPPVLKEFPKRQLLDY